MSGLANGLDGLNDFIRLHAAQLDAAAVPAYFWGTIFNKLKNEVFDAGASFLMARSDDEDELTVVVKAERMDCFDENNIFLVDHAWTFEIRDAMLQLRSVPGLLKRMSDLVGLNSELETPEAAEEVFQSLWKYLRTYSQVIAADEPPVEFWYVMDEFGSAIKHSSNPNFRAVPFYYHGDGTAYTLLFPVRDVEENEQVVIDYVEGTGSVDTRCREALLVPWTGQRFDSEPDVQIEPDDTYFLSGALSERLPTDSELLPMATHPTSHVFKVFSEYSRVNEYLSDPGFEIVESEHEADILWLTRHFTDFAGLKRGTFINQFPCERVLTTKDLLAIVSRRGGHPNWLPLTYNMVTELPTFVGVFQRREFSGLDNHWICKPWNLARALGATVSNNLDCILRLPFSGPKIVQKYAERPVLFDREDVGMVKFDVRYVVLLQSVEPLKLYVYKKFFLRFANKPFELRELWDYEKHFTVMNYRETSPLHHMLCHDFVLAFEDQYPQYKWEEIEEKILSALKEVFTKACSAQYPRGLVHFPQSRAVYAADLILHWNDDEIQPLLLEINYGPDCDRACNYYPNFYNDIFSLLFKNSNISQFHVL